MTPIQLAIGTAATIFVYQTTRRFLQISSPLARIVILALALCVGLIIAQSA